MSSRSQREAISILVDCGKSMSQKCGKNDLTVFQLSKQCIINIIKQKIFAESKNEYQLIQFSTNDENNQNNIKINGNLCSPNFDLLRYVSNIESTNIQTNVIDALNVAANQLLDSVKGQKFSTLKLAIFANFGQFNRQDFDDFNSLISSTFIPNEIQLIIICEFTPNSDLRDLSKSQLLGIEAMKLIEEQSVGLYYDLEYANNYFSYFECKKPSPSPWYANLEIGKGVNALNVPIVGYVKVTAYKKKTGTESYVKTTTSNDNESVEQKPETSVSATETPIEKVVTYRPHEDQSMEELEKEEVISAYCYGSSLVPFNEEDKHLFNYQSTEKGLKVIGFTSIHNICAAHQIGDKTVIVIPDPRPKQNNHKLVFQTLARAMLEKQEVAIVRYAYRDKSSPQIGYLSPHIEDKDIMLIYIQLPFDEDVRRYRFPLLESKPQYCPTKPQLEAIDELIDAMDLMDADVDDDGDVCEALQTENIYDPFLQYWFQCLYHRQMYKNSVSLPLPSDQLRDTIEPPLKIRQNADRFLRKVSQKFPLDHVKDKSSKKRNQMIENQESDGSEAKRAKTADSDINIVFENINELIKSEAPFSQIGHQLEDSIKDFCIDAVKVDKFSEHIIDLIKMYRKESIHNNDPKGFNDFMKSYMKTLRGTTIWYLMLSQEIGLISRSECDSSDVSQEDVENFTNLTDDYIKVEND